MTKRVLSVLTALALVLSLFPVFMPHLHAEDAAKIEPNDEEFSAYLGEDGWIWAKYTHIHQHLDGYTALENGQHEFSCSCGETVTEACTYAWLSDDSEHWLACDYCGQMDEASVETHTPQENCLCECGDYVHQVESWTVYSEDINHHTGFCTACAETVLDGHDLTWGYDDAEHWTGCGEDCGYKAAVEEHQWYDWLPDVGGFHYHNCSCGMTQAERHTDDDNDLICDICGDNMCVDANGDHICDDCYYTMDELCVDADGDHRCDTEACGERQEEWCVDADNNHICDVAACGVSLYELCKDDNDDWLCDVCGTDLCSHWIPDPVSNDDNTHTGICSDCGREITEECDKTYGVVWDETHHQGYCSCGRSYEKEPHNFSNLTNKTLTSHVLDCTACGESILEAHRFVGGTCEICQAEQVDVYDVYVGGVGLKNGQYVDQAGNVTTAQPDGGYAHYEEGVLKLYNYTCEGKDILWKEDEGAQYTAVIYATVDLVLELSGDNSLNNTSGESDVERDGIAAEGDLTIRGEGSLTVLADNDGIYLRNGDLTMEEGCVSLGVLEYDEYGDILASEEIGDDGMDVDGNVIIEGGVLNIYSDDHGMDVSDDVIIRGGTVDVTADDDGLNVDGDTIILGGDVTVVADDYGLDSNGGSVTVAGGSVDVSTEYWSGIYADDFVEISGGTLRVTAGEAGIQAGHVMMLGGSSEIYGGWVAIWCQELTLGMELPEGAYVQDDAGEIYVDAEGDLVIEGEVGAMPRAASANGRILLEDIPEGLTVMVAGYENGQMKELQVLENVIGDVKISAAVLDCEEVLAFLLEDNCNPLRRTLIVQ